MVFPAAHAALNAALAGLVLVPFGSLAEHLGRQNPWRGFDAHEAKLVVVRAERVPNASCSAWIEALGRVSFEDGAPVGSAPPANPLESLRKGWGGFDEDELKDIRKCDDLPCAVKLGAEESARMGEVKKDAREAKYLELVKGRIDRYRATGERSEYEYPGAPVEPWAYLSGKGFKTALPMPGEPKLFARRLELAPGKAKALHQVLDRRAAVSADKKEAVLWARDAYTDHYFDSWGEWVQVRCEAGKGVTVVQALFVEFDLLKKHDLVSRIMRGKMKSAVEDQGRGLQERFFAALERAATSASK